MARPTKFTPERQRIILESLRAGLSRYAAAGRAEIGAATLDDWIARFRDFREQVGIAEQTAAARFEAVIVKAASEQDDATALQWLKRRRREDWGDNLTQKADVQHSGNVGVNLGDEAILLAAEEIRRRSGSLPEDA